MEHIEPKDDVVIWEANESTECVDFAVSYDLEELSEFSESVDLCEFCKLNGLIESIG